VDFFYKEDLIDLIECVCELFYKENTIYLIE